MVSAGVLDQVVEHSLEIGALNLFDLAVFFFIGRLKLDRTIKGGFVDQFLSFQPVEKHLDDPPVGRDRTGRQRVTLLVIEVCRYAPAERYRRPQVRQELPDFPPGDEPRVVAYGVAEPGVLVPPPVKFIDLFRVV